MPAWRGRQAFGVTIWKSASCKTRYTDLHARASRYFDFPSIKTAENVDGSFKNKLPSMKNGKNVDEKYKTRLPSMKRAVFVDGKMIL